MKSISLQESKLYYEEKGTGSALVLLHAGVADSRMWDEQFDVFAESHRVVRCDLRGYGNSLLPNGAFAYHEDILALLDFLNISSAWLIGASFGAKVAVDLYLSNPKRVRGLLLVSPVVGGFQPTEDIIQFNEREDALLEAGNLEDATELNLKMWVDGPHRSSSEADQSVRSRVAEMQLQAFSQSEPDGVSLKNINPPAFERLDEIKIPMLIISGALDVPAFILLSETLENQVPGAKRIVVPDAAHMVSMEAPQMFNDLVLEFISDYEKRDSIA